MADNTTLNTGTGGDIIRTDDIAGVKYPVSKIAIGIDGANDGLVSATTPLPINDAGGSLTVDGTVAVSGTVPVSGTITANAGTGPFPVSDNAGSLTVDGTVTANAGTGPWPVTDNGGSLTVDDGGASLTVDGTVAVSGTVPVSDAGSTLSVDDGAGSLTVDGAVSITGTVPVTDNGGSLTVDGTVDVTNAGTFSVQASSVTPGTAASNLGKAEDAVHSNGATGVMMLGVRSDVAASTAGTDGDYQPPITDSSGRLWVNASGAAVPVTDNAGSLTVDNAGTFAVQDSQVIADDAAFGVGTSKVFPAGFLADQTAPDSVDEGDIGAARMTLDRFQKVVAQLESSSMRIGGTAVTPQFAPVAVTASGNNQVVAADATKKIRVLKWTVIADADNSIKWRSASTDLTGAMSLPADGAGASGSFCPVGHFETVANEALNLNLVAATAVAGYLVYIKV